MKFILKYEVSNDTQYTELYCDVVPRAGEIVTIDDHSHFEVESVKHMFARTQENQVIVLDARFIPGKAK